MPSSPIIIDFPVLFQHIGVATLYIYIRVTSRKKYTSITLSISFFLLFPIVLGGTSSTVLFISCSYFNRRANELKKIEIYICLLPFSYDTRSFCPSFSFAILSEAYLIFIVFLNGIQKSSSAEELFTMTQMLSL